jgi:hypothetical protein
MCIVFRAAAVILVLLVGTDGRTEEFGWQGPLRVIPSGTLNTILPADTHLMMQPVAIERFLATLDETPPDWPKVYGQGHHDPAYDDRLFALNRKRDVKRESSPALSWRLAFAWVGELSPYRDEIGGFPVALGPKFIKTSWGMVRFKPEEAPGNLSVTTDADLREQFSRRLESGQTVEIDVVMTGKLIPEESIMYDFSHNEAGLGLIMPFVRVERVEFVMAP